MPWNTVFPNGAISVKANQIIGQQNTTYTKTTMNVDHYWDAGGVLDGHHKFIKAPAFAVGADPALGAGVNGVIYLRTVSTSNARVEGFYKNTNGIYQFIPSFVSGTHAVTNAFTTIVTVPANCYGEIFMFKNDNNENGQVGFFKSGAATVQSYSYGLRFQGGSTAAYNLRFGNGSDASGLDIRVINDAGGTGNYEYRITYRAI
jgi:hypothetical protein